MSRYLIRLLGAIPPGGDVVPDAELLRRYATTRDAAAFELLVRRHANTVWAACARVLRNEADADDAFQTTFLVLAKKASAVRGECAGAWLHRVAVHAALKLKAKPTRSVSDGVERERPDRLEADDLAAVHEELARLPERYRLPVVLCDLEGQSRTEAARVLGWPLGSVNGRLSRARDLLRDRLARRGFVAPAVLGASVAPSHIVHAAATRSAVSPVVCSLAEGVLSAMRIAKLKVAAVLTVGLLGVAGVGAVVAHSGQPQPPTATVQPEKPPAAKPPEQPFTAFPELKPPVNPPRPRDGEPDQAALRAILAKACPNICGDAPVRIFPTDDPYRKLLKTQLNEGHLEVSRFQRQINIGRFTSSDYGQHQMCLTDMRAVAIELWTNEPKILTPWLEEFVILAKVYERFTKTRVEAGTDPSQMLNIATRHRLAAEAALWKAKNPPKR